MPITEKERRQIVNWYCFVFYLLMLFKWWNGMLLFQTQPFIFNNRVDLFTWIFMSSGLHRWLLNNFAGAILSDIVFIAMPLLYRLAYQRSILLSRWVALLMLMVNWIYLQCYTLYPTYSIEGAIAWLLFPVLFLAGTLRSFYYVLHGLRFFFLYFFASAGMWKIVQQGLFNTRQMSGVLLFQHKEYLAGSPDTVYSTIIYWLIAHQKVSYLLYLSGAAAELFFITGFFTRRFDRWLIAIFLLFLFLDAWLMRIHYWDVMPFLLTLLYSKYTVDKSADKKPNQD